MYMWIKVKLIEILYYTLYLRLMFVDQKSIYTLTYVKTNAITNSKYKTKINIVSQ